MNKLNIFWLNPPLYTRTIYPDLAWMNFNTYVPEHNWISPIINWEEFVNVDSVVSHIIDQNTDVLCISTYTWNHILCHKVSEKIKQLNPKIIIIKGGPHQGYNFEFFKNYPYIDYLCYATGHGEYFLKEALTQIANHGKIIDEEAVPFLISRKYKSLIINSKYNYPTSSSIENNFNYLSDVILVATEQDKEVSILYETTRGCPYSCTYCEWGGGTGVKVSQKNIEIIKKEVEILSLLGFKKIEIVDANFGILERDVGVANFFGEMKNKYNCPDEVMLYGLAKTSIKKREKILDILYKHNLISDYFVTLQTLNPEVMANIKRTDIDIADNLRLAEKYKKLYNAKPLLEIIMGLPGSTLNDFYVEMDYFQRLGCAEGWEKMRNTFTLLPDSPASSPEYIQKHKIKYSVVGVMENEENNLVKISQSVINQFRSSSVFVTETYSYTQEEWKEMLFLNRMQRKLGILIKPEIKASIFFKVFYDNIKSSEYFSKIQNHLDNIVNGSLHDKDILLVEDNKLIEDIVMEEYVNKNKKFFKQYLDI